MTPQVSEIFSGFKQAVSNKTAKTALLLCTVMWIGGGMGTGMGVIDFQFEFLFVEELDWDSQGYCRHQRCADFPNHDVGFLGWRASRSKFGSKRTLTPL